jgi:hypothetical protein
MHRASGRCAALIVEDHSGAGPQGDPVAQHRETRHILAACAAEAGRLSDGLAELDRAIGQALAEALEQADPRVLQRLDLLRQEADGLARLLALATSMPAPDAMIDTDAIARCVPLAAQRARLTSGRPDP